MHRTMYPPRKLLLYMLIGQMQRVRVASASCPGKQRSQTTPSGLMDVSSH